MHFTCNEGVVGSNPTKGSRLTRVEPYFATVNIRRMNLEMAVTVILQNLQISYNGFIILAFQAWDFSSILNICSQPVVKSGEN